MGFTKPETSNYFRQLSYNNGIYHTQLGDEEQRQQTGETTLPSSMAQEGITCSFPSHLTLDQQIHGCGDLQSLSLSMSPGSQSSCVTVPITECIALETKKRGSSKIGRSNLFIENLSTLLVKELHSIEVLLDIDGLVDMKLNCGIIVARRKGKLGKGGK